MCIRDRFGSLYAHIIWTHYCRLLIYRKPSRKFELLRSSDFILCVHKLIDQLICMGVPQFDHCIFYTRHVFPLLRLWCLLKSRYLITFDTNHGACIIHNVLKTLFWNFWILSIADGSPKLHLVSPYGFSNCLVYYTNLEQMTKHLLCK